MGSEIVNVYGDRTTRKALSTVAYDDDGVKTTKFPILDKGMFVGYQTIRDQAHLIGETESRGCCYAQSWADVPFQRMPNVWLAPGEAGTSLEDLLSGIDDGILIEGNGSFSIDQQRYNFQFGGDAFWEIKGGKKRGMCRASRTSRARPISGRPATASPGRPIARCTGAPTTARESRDRSTR